MGDDGQLVVFKQPLDEVRYNVLSAHPQPLGLSVQMTAGEELINVLFKKNKDFLQYIVSGAGGMVTGSLPIPSTYSNLGWVVGSSAVIGVGAVAAVAVALGAAGFTASGVAAGSAAAAWQSSIGSVAAGSWFATLQSVGAVGGLSAAASGGVVAGTQVGGMVLNHVSKDELDEAIQTISKLCEDWKVAEPITDDVKTKITVCVFSVRNGGKGAAKM
eukprot:TRINITY_DN1262_c0_g1_i2.p1 TRINITY_DN1262_c0_g1~~TRINITY_DN1262_c0_g1_i2.p1  ORF type:complete len:216 (+),score=24.05 TRINITY_DN1262_c0_g1_i2:56-703(+)